MTRKFLPVTILLDPEIVFRVIDQECHIEAGHYIWNLPGKTFASLHEPSINFPSDKPR